jgi:hypothetical protein
LDAQNTIDVSQAEYEIATTKVIVAAVVRSIGPLSRRVMVFLHQPMIRFEEMVTANDADNGPLPEGNSLRSQLWLRSREQPKSRPGDADASMNIYAGAGSKLLFIFEVTNAYVQQEGICRRLKPGADLTYPLSRGGSQTLGCDLDRAFMNHWARRPKGGFLIHSLPSKVEAPARSASAHPLASPIMV